MELSRKIQHLGDELQAKIGSLQADLESSTGSNVCVHLRFSGMSRLIGKLDNAVRSAQHVVTLASINKHFYTPQAVSSIFTGRVADLDTLRRCLQAPAAANQTNAQKRFVVYGLPGSGKTQFCCKFASDNKQRYHQASIQKMITRSSW